MPQKLNKVRVAYLSTLIPALSATFIYREILELERRGYCLKLYSLRKADLRTLSADSLELVNRVWVLLPVTIGNLIFSHLYYAFSKPHRYLRAFWKMIIPRQYVPKGRLRSALHFGEGVVLARRMRQDGITHIHAHYISQAASVARVVHLVTGIPYSISAHAHDIWHDRLLIKEKLQEARFIACCSQCGQRELLHQGEVKYAGKVHLIYHGINVRHFIPPADRVRSSDLILAVGRFESVKGYPHLVEACRILKERGIKFRCRIVGDGEERPLVVSLIKQYELGDYIELTGAVKQENLLKHYQEAAVFVLPCIPAPDGRHDGIPNVLVEAMATGLPVVTTPLGGIAELVNDGREGLLVPSGDSQTLALRLAQLLGDRLLRHNLGDRGRERIVEHFDNRQTIEPLIGLFERECGLQTENQAALGGRAEKRKAKCPGELLGSVQETI